ncbi:hypothetical protein F4860DRAFT_521981 [Xylaria cubensis]|nr:hypothetical protein F4860DRAFT_521981 [Xylaria cubensis]
MASTYERIASWPKNLIAPRSGKERHTQIFTNSLLLLLILLFFIYADLIRRSDRMLRDAPCVRELDKVSHYGPTIFPILFTLVVGGTLRSLALYRLQVGEKIGYLDLLFGSTTLGSAIETLFERRFRYFDINSVGLLLLWALSPLGGQATLRVIGYDDVLTTRPLELSYLDYTRSTFPDLLLGDDLGASTIASASAFVSSFSSPISFQTSASDLWGNVKTPVLETLPGYKSANPGDWVRVPVDSTEISYASLIGVPIGNVPEIGRTQFQTEVAYWDMECPNFRAGTLQDIFDTSSLFPQQNISGSPIYSIHTPDLQGGASTWGWILSNTSAESVNQRCYSNSTSDPPRRQLMYRSWNDVSDDPESDQTVANCSIGTSYVEVSVHCDGWHCGVDRVRRSLQHPKAYSTAVTGLDSCYNLYYPSYVVSQFFWLLLRAVDNQLTSSAQPGILQFYIQHPNRTQGYFQDIHLNDIGNETFAQRFSVLLNTYWSAIYNNNLTSNGLFDNTLLFDDNFYFENPITNTTGTTTISESRFVFNRAWYAVLVISSSTLFFTAFCKLILDLHILIPDLQMNASTLLRGNMDYCLNAPDNGTAMDDNDRSRLLRYHRVRFGHRLMGVKHAGELGIGELKEEGGFVKHLTKGDKYY